MKQIPISTLTLNNSTFLGKGGEAEVYKLDQKTVAKIFKDRNHPDWMSDPEREAAANKLVEYQNKLKMFPSGLPINVITPIDLILKYNKIVGYTMRFLDKGEVLKKYSEKTFREKLGKDNNVVAELFTQSGHMHIDRARGHAVGADPPDAGQQFVTWNRAPPVRDQVP